MRWADWLPISRKYQHCDWNPACLVPCSFSRAPWVIRWARGLGCASFLSFSSFPLSTFFRQKANHESLTLEPPGPRFAKIYPR